MLNSLTVAGTRSRAPSARSTPSTSAQLTPFTAEMRWRFFANAGESRFAGGVGSPSSRLSQIVGSPSSSIAGAFASFARRTTQWRLEPCAGFAAGVSVSRMSGSSAAAAGSADAVGSSSSGAIVPSSAASASASACSAARASVSDCGNSVGSADGSASGSGSDSGAGSASAGGADCAASSASSCATCAQIVSSSPVACINAAQRAGSRALATRSPAPAVKVAAAKNTRTSPKLVASLRLRAGRRAAVGGADSSEAWTCGVAFNVSPASDHSSHPRLGRRPVPDKSW